MHTYSLKAQAAYLLAGKIGAYAIRLMTPMILVRLLTSSDYGIYRQILLIVTLTTVLAQMKIQLSLYYFFPRLQNAHKTLISQTFTILLISTFILSSLFVFIGWHFQIFFNTNHTLIIFTIGLIIYLENIGILIDHIFVLEKRSVLVTIANIVNSALRSVSMIAFIFVFRDVISVIYALVLYGIIKAGVTVWYLARTYSIRFGFPDRQLLRRQLTYLMPMSMSHILQVMGHQIDKALIAALMSPEDFAIYVVGGLVTMQAVRLLYQSVGEVVLPRLGELALQHDVPAIKRLWHSMIQANALITLPLVCFLMFFADEFISLLYTKQYLASANILRLHLLILPMQMLGFGRIPTALGQTKAILHGTIVQASSAILLSWGLIPYIGFYGGAISMVLSFWADGSIQLAASKKSLHATFFTFLPWKHLITITVASFLPALLCKLWLNPARSDLAILVIAGLLYTGVVSILFYCLGYIKINKLKMLLMNLKPNRTL